MPLGAKACSLYAWLYIKCVSQGHSAKAKCAFSQGVVCVLPDAFMQGCKPLHTAAATEKAESVRLLLTYGADVGAIDKQVSFGGMIRNLCCTQIEICDGTVIFCFSAARYTTRLVVELVPRSGVFSFQVFPFLFCKQTATQYW